MVENLILLGAINIVSKVIGPELGTKLETGLLLHFTASHCISSLAEEAQEIRG